MNAPKRGTTLLSIFAVVLSLPTIMSAPAFKAWFRKETKKVRDAIRQNARTGSAPAMVFVQLFIPRSSRMKLGHREFERLLGDASVGNISMQIEVTEVDSPLTPSEVAAEQEEARQALLSTADSETPGFVFQAIRIM